MNLTTTAPAPAANPFGGSPGGEATDAMWVIMATFIIFTMQSGFGLLESGKHLFLNPNLLSKSW